MVHSVFNEEQELLHEFGFSTIHFTMEVMASYDLHDLYFNKMNDQIKESPSAQLHIIFTQYTYIRVKMGFFSFRGWYLSRG